EVGKKGVVRDKNVHLSVIESILNFVPEIGMTVMGLDFSPIKGPEGNIEYLCYLKKGSYEPAEIDPKAIVEASHEVL
ncbi:MAG: TlyA family RNA methyltransferase, partial [Clostridia bacterium]|nr:TlyA family RNA methyltransferase [Clostridia bacterium]